MELSDYRKEIDRIDREMVKLFTERMDIAADIGRCKQEKGLPVYDPERERQKLGDLTAQTREDLSSSVEGLYSTIFELSRSYQRMLHPRATVLRDQIEAAIQKTPRLFPERALVACQGVEGAYSQQACEKVFKRPQIMYFNSFEGVFSAIDKGLCPYGILPLENSTAGSVNKIYDLMMEYNFHIIRSTRIKVDHSLLVLPGVKKEEVREIFSHEQALSQCTEFLEEMKGVKITPCANTAAAAKMVFESGRKDAAAISSRSCAQIYGLDCLADSIQNQGSNYTRFICIAKDLEIYPGSDTTSVMMTLPHRPGSLYRALSRFNALGINIQKLESRPLPGSDFEFMFYFDFEASVYSPEFLSFFEDIDGIATRFVYLGSYLECK